MKTILMNTLTAILALCFTSADLSDENLMFEDWDSNDNSLISRSEFVEQFTSNYVHDWNVIDDDHLDDEDFYTVIYNMWDLDDDERLTEEEWKYSIDYLYGDYVAEDFVAFDTDNDGYIEYVEYYDVLFETDFYDMWDVNDDGYLNEYELARMVFNNWDYDDSNFIERDEYTDFDAFYLDI